MELASAEDVLDYPKHPATKEYVSLYRGLPGCQVIGGKLAQAFEELRGDDAIQGSWLSAIERRLP